MAMPEPLVDSGKEAPAAPKKSILLVEDSVFFLTMLGEAFSRRFDCVLARDKDEAIRLFRMAFESGNPFEAVMTDMDMPAQWDGCEVVRTVKELSPATLVFLFSGRAGDSDAPTEERLLKPWNLFDAKFQKPLDYKTLLSSVLSAINAKNAIQKEEKTTGFPSANPRPGAKNPPGQLLAMK